MFRCNGIQKRSVSVRICGVQIFCDLLVRAHQHSEHRLITSRYSRMEGVFPVIAIVAVKGAGLPFDIIISIKEGPEAFSVIHLSP